MSLKFSNYNILHCPVAPFAAESEKVLLWNTVTGSFRAFEGKSGAAVRRAVSNGRPEMFTDELIRDFVDGGFLIPEEKDELSILEAELSAVRLFRVYRKLFPYTDYDALQRCLPLLL